MNAFLEFCFENVPTLWRIKNELSKHQSIVVLSFSFELRTLSETSGDLDFVQDLQSQIDKNEKALSIKNEEISNATEKIKQLVEEIESNVSRSYRYFSSILIDHLEWIPRLCAFVK